ncbi:alpha,alpha-trehalose-phosphate synthase (UDP-forming) [Aminobacterium colombiense]|uniref:Alpha,alpha-trehalose-phosphate synthase (UDP-forming) n=1 Tax=Aminobacterium colombiense (strain DSM 12261 / ALA-1) TaxID=572547 RepID=D5ECW2_AMICL|nr:trehalose-6-phosphate synthase [Aminobacterium colombiense]ADE56394.1 Alpha,alpha-trehalose-phosphate synthase (UDP- forming) [Aminobacterium colombiense DSM 12261]MDD2379195.1 trehalose-6-phosphate synthase [Aminobacterium colombiense]
MADKERMIVVSNRLPIILKKRKQKWSVEPGAGGLVTALSPVLKDRGGMWIGWPGTRGRINLSGLRKILGPISEETGFRIVPILLENGEIDNYYYGFSNSIIWPLFHDLEALCRFQPQYWEAYVRVSDKFAAVIAKHSTEKDIIWVNDYQLILLAGSLERLGVKRHCVFFLHIPFPSPDLFIKLPWRKQIIDELLRFSFLCFQTHRDRRNFIDCARSFYPACRVVGRGAIVELEIKGHTIQIGSLPISIDYKRFRSMASAKEAALRSREIRKDITADFLVLGIDRLDYTKGIPEKLRAFARALEKYPHLQGKISLFQLIIPSREGVAEYGALRDEIQKLISEINGRFSTTAWVPILYRYGTVDQKELVAMYRAADAGFVSSLKDGMNLVCKEYCACQTDYKGVLILSEFAGAAYQLRSGAILINPYDVEATADALYYSIFMKEEEKKNRMRRMCKSIRERDVYWWVNNFLRAAAGKELKDFPEAELPEFWPGLRKKVFVFKDKKGGENDGVKRE